MSKIRQLLLAMGMLVLCALAIGACGGDDDDDTGEDDNGSIATAEATDQDSSGDDEETAAPEDEPTDEPEGDDDDDDSGSSGASVEDPCSLVTQVEVEAALGEPVQAPVVTFNDTSNLPGGGQANVGTCSYVSGESIASVNLNVWSAPGDSEGIDTMIDLACDGKEAIDDLGDVACWYDDQHVEIQLASGDFFLDIFATTEGDSSAALLEISEKAISRLP